MSLALGVLVYRQTTSLHVLHHNVHVDLVMIHYRIHKQVAWKLKGDKKAASYRLASLSNPLSPRHGFRA